MLAFVIGMNPKDVLTLMQQITGKVTVGGEVLYYHNYTYFYPETHEEYCQVGLLPAISFIHVLEDLGYEPTYD